MRGRPDRALRREIARLAGLRPEDLAALLDELDAPYRARVESLLRALVSPEAPVEGELFASWIGDRLAGGGEMTEDARRLLARCAERIVPPRPARSPSLFERALGAGNAAR